MRAPRKTAALQSACFDADKRERRHAFIYMTYSRRRFGHGERRCLTGHALPDAARIRRAPRERVRQACSNISRYER